MTVPLTLPVVPFTGSAGAVSSDVPGTYDVALGGRGYMIDYENREPYRFQTLPLLRSQSDSGSTPGANSINPEGLWRRAWEEWHLGAGQADLDRETSVPQQYRASKGINPWKRWELSLLADTTESLDSSATNLGVLSAGDRLYVADNQTLRFTADPFADTPSYTAVTGTPAAAITGLASTGYRIMIAHGASGLYRTETDSSTAVSWVTGTIDDVSFVKGRVLVASGAELHEITASLTASADTLATHGTSLFSHPDSNFTWVGFAEGLNHIYAAGYSGDRSEVYRITIAADGTGLTAPTIAGRLPDGEVVSSIYGYLGQFVFVGTTQGFRLAVADSSGNLTFGSLVETGSTVRAWEGQGQYVWFTWEGFDSVSGGLGRLDLANLSDEGGLVPAYASDLMATTTANILSVATHSSKRVFAVSGDGIYAEDTNLVSSGFIDSGLIGFGLSENKTAVNVKTSQDFAGGGTVTVALCEDDMGFTTLGSRSAGASTTFSGNETLGSRHEIRVTLTRNGTDATKGPRLLSATLQAYPNVPGSQVAIIPILLRSVLDAANGTEIDVDVIAERDALEALWRNRTLTTFQEGSRSHVGLIEDLAWEAEDKSDRLVDFGKTQGTVVVRFKIIEGATDG